VRTLTSIFFLLQSTFRRSDFEMEQDVINLKHPAAAMMIDLRSDSNISPIPPVIFARVKSAKSGLNCKFGF